MAKRILSVSNNPRLLLARNDMLALAGYAVSSPRSPQEAIQLYRQNAYDVIVIGHSVPPPERAAIIRAIQGIGPRVPIIFAAPAGEPPELLADETADIGNPDALIQALNRVLA